jgi:hypothetical protein
MQREIDGFAAFYNEKHQGHKIEWNHALGTVSLRARFAAGQKELSVSLYQAIVLLLFNEMAEVPFSDVKLLAGIGRSRPPLHNRLTDMDNPFIQRMQSYDAHSKAWPAERKRYSRNGQLERM